MKYLSRFLVVLTCVYSSTNLIYGQWVKGDGPYGASINCFAVNGVEAAGIHEVQFDGSTLASEVYFYRIQAGTFVQTKKLLLLK